MFCVVVVVKLVLQVASYCIIATRYADFNLVFWSCARIRQGYIYYYTYSTVVLLYVVMRIQSTCVRAALGSVALE